MFRTIDLNQMFDLLSDASVFLFSSYVTANSVNTKTYAAKENPLIAASSWWLHLQALQTTRLFWE